MAPTRGPYTTWGMTSMMGTPATSSMSRCWTSSRAASRSGPKGICSVASNAASMSSSQKFEMLRNEPQTKFVEM